MKSNSYKAVAEQTAPSVPASEPGCIAIKHGNAAALSLGFF
ncbi:MAG TPA: hypothetical protein VMJ12_10905 [Candidatus Acidoferrales bacterium]|nr:hypothetical protein [Candidatus Acidoferrales bacterium]